MNPYRDAVQLILKPLCFHPLKNRHSWEFVVVEEREMLSKLPDASPRRRFIADAALAVVVLGNPLESDAWVEMPP